MRIGLPILVSLFCLALAASAPAQATDEWMELYNLMRGFEKKSLDQRVAVVDDVAKLLTKESTKTLLRILVYDGETPVLIRAAKHLEIRKEEFVADTLAAMAMGLPFPNETEPFPLSFYGNTPSGQYRGMQPSVRAAIGKALRDRKETGRIIAALGAYLLEKKPESGGALLVGTVTTPDPGRATLRTCLAAELLGWIGDARAVPHLKEALSYKKWEIRASAAAALGHVPHADVPPVLCTALEDADPDVRRTAKCALERVEWVLEAMEKARREAERRSNPPDGDGEGTTARPPIEPPEPPLTPEAARRADVVFLFDATFSMAKKIALVKDKILNIMRQHDTSYSDLRFAVVAFRDYNNQFTTCSRYVTWKRDEIEKMIKETKATGGNREGDSLDMALAVATNLLNWRKDAAKSIYIFSDVPPNSMETATRFARQLGLYEDCTLHFYYTCDSIGGLRKVKTAFERLSREAGGTIEALESAE
ncbi:MAG: HEAT repeat domain-containing protein [Planctomycetota bacterium]|nr:HEAT repeat domain-containing protein [Planctomycetota bacterium]